MLLCGINPGVTSAQTSWHYAHRSNHFWRCLAQSGLTAAEHAPSASPLLPTLAPYALGLTNLCARPTAEATELGAHEMAAGAPLLARKIRAHATPRVTAFVGKGIALAFQKAHEQHSRRTCASASASVTLTVPHDTPLAWAPTSPAEKGYGLLPLCILLPPPPSPPPPQPQGAPPAARPSLSLLWALPSTSARVTSVQLPHKVAAFARLRNLVDALRDPDPDPDPDPDKPGRQVELRVVQLGLDE